MNKTTIQQILLFVLLVLLQIWLFNNIHLFGVATPFVYVYFTLKLPVKKNRNVVLLLSALIGLIIDLFGSTLGLNMFVMVVIGFLRFYLLKLFAPRDIFEDYVPSFETLGNFMFVRYIGILTLIHVIVLHLMESFTLFNPVNLILRIVGSFILTVVLICAFESIDIKRFKK
jgi:rod shape-determining protein MreD